VEGVGWAVAELISRTTTALEVKLIREIATKFGESIGRINAIDPTQARANKASEQPFKFAGEPQKTEPELLSTSAVAVDLPAFLAGRVH
jgi:hypothetical protein